MTICVKGFTDLQKFLMKRINPLAGLIATLPASLSVKLLIAKCHGSRYKKALLLTYITSRPAKIIC